MSSDIFWHASSEITLHLCTVFNTSVILNPVLLARSTSLCDVTWVISGRSARLVLEIPVLSVVSGLVGKALVAVISKGVEFFPLLCVSAVKHSLPPFSLAFHWSSSGCGIIRSCGPPTVLITR